MSSRRTELSMNKKTLDCINDISPNRGLERFVEKGAYAIRAGDFVVRH